MAVIRSTPYVFSPTVRAALVEERSDPATRIRTAAAVAWAAVGTHTAREVPGTPEDSTPLTADDTAGIGSATALSWDPTPWVTPEVARAVGAKTATTGRQSMAKSIARESWAGSVRTLPTIDIPPHVDRTAPVRTTAPVPTAVLVRAWRADVAAAEAAAALSRAALPHRLARREAAELLAELADAPTWRPFGAAVAAPAVPHGPRAPRHEAAPGPVLPIGRPQTFPALPALPVGPSEAAVAAAEKAAEMARAARAVKAAESGKAAARARGRVNVTRAHRVATGVASTRERAVHLADTLLAGYPVVEVGTAAPAIGWASNAPGRRWGHDRMAWLGKSNGRRAVNATKARTAGTTVAAVAGKGDEALRLRRAAARLVDLRETAAAIGAALPVVYAPTPVGYAAAVAALRLAPGYGSLPAKVRSGHSRATAEAAPSA